LRVRLTERWLVHGMLAANFFGTALFAVFWKFTPLAQDTATVLLAGFCGALTTFSGFAAELLRRATPGGVAALLLAGFVPAGAALWWVVGGEVEPPAPAFPFGTLAANLGGCLLYGWLDARLRSDGWRRALLGGFLGGLTTFSALLHETHQCCAGGRAGMGAAYVLATVCGGVGLMALGRAGAGKR
jgi:fluoride exporter